MDKKRTDIKKLVRENILQLQPYASARSEFQGSGSVFLDANENAFGSPLPDNYHRYPDPLQLKLKQKLASLNNVSEDSICVGNGSDDLIDYILRIFCVPAKDSIIVCPPTFRMYEVAAGINDIAIKKILLTSDFQPDLAKILEENTIDTKVLFLCSPNNPTGNDIEPEKVQKILSGFNGIVVIDEAYIHYSQQPSFLRILGDYNNLIILQTLSKAWGLAALRVGVAFGDPEVIQLMNNIKMPYNVNGVSQSLALAALNNKPVVDQWRNEIIEQRNWVERQLAQFSYIEKSYPSVANFILVRVRDSKHFYNYLISNDIVVRNQGSQPMLENCLRITIGTNEENKLLIQALKKYKE